MVIDEGLLRYSHCTSEVHLRLYILVNSVELPVNYVVPQQDSESCSLLPAQSYSTLIEDC